jgi:hypothetical protein
MEYFFMDYYGPEYETVVDKKTGKEVRRRLMKPFRGHEKSEEIE